MEKSPRNESFLGFFYIFFSSDPEQEEIKSNLLLPDHLLICAILLQTRAVSRLHDCILDTDHSSEPKS